MADNLDSDVLLSSIISDFEAAWEGIATVKTTERGGGNFLFALQAMLLLEVFCRSCGRSDHGKSLHQKFSQHLKRAEPKYFTRLPRSTKRYHPQEFWLPTDLPFDEEESRKDAPLIGFLFDLIRNGLSHQYQQIRVNLKEEKHLCVAIGGADQGTRLEDSLTSERSVDHLTLLPPGKEGDIWLIVRADILFLHLKQAIQNAVTGTVLPPPEYLERSIEASASEIRELLTKRD